MNLNEYTDKLKAFYSVSDALGLGTEFMTKKRCISIVQKRQKPAENNGFRWLLYVLCLNVCAPDRTRTYTSHDTRS